MTTTNGNGKCLKSNVSVLGPADAGPMAEIAAAYAEAVYGKRDPVLGATGAAFAERRERIMVGSYRKLDTIPADRLIRLAGKTPTAADRRRSVPKGAA